MLQIRLMIESARTALAKIGGAISRALFGDRDPDNTDSDDDGQIG